MDGGWWMVDGAPASLFELRFSHRLASKSTAGHYRPGHGSSISMRKTQRRRHEYAYSSIAGIDICIGMHR